MSSIWAVKEKEDNGQVKFQKQSTVCQQIEFSKILSAVDTQTLNDSTMSIAEKIADLAPTKENVEKISEYMHEKIRKAFKNAGIAPEPEVTFSVGTDGNLNISGDRNDIEKIRTLFENDESLAQDMKDFLQFAEQMPEYERMLEYRIKCANAETEAEKRLLDMEYADLFDGKDHYDVSAVYGSEGLGVEASYKE